MSSNPDAHFLNKSELIRYLEQVSQQYLQFKEQAEQQAHNWRWASDQMHEPHPHWFLIHQFTSGRWLKVRPKRSRSPHLYGFDPQGRIVVVRNFISSDVDTDYRCYEEFFSYQGDIVEGVLFSEFYPKTVFAKTTKLVSNGQIVASESVGIYGQNQQKYTYDHDLFIGISGRGDSSSYGPYMDAYRLFYDPSGNVQNITRIYNGGSEKIIYRRLSPTENIPALSSKLEQLLVAQIPEVIAAAHISKPVYCLVLAYDSESIQPFAPYLGLGQEIERRDKQEHAVGRLNYQLFNPAEFQLFETPELQIADAEVLKTSELLNQVIAFKNAGYVVRRVLVNVARQLQELSWDEVLPHTEDFVVVATDLELHDLAKNMKKILPHDIWETWKKHKLA